MLTMSFVCFLSKFQLSLAELVCATDSDFVLWIIQGDVLRLLCATSDYCKEVLVYSCKAVQFIVYNTQLRSGLSPGQESWKEKLCVVEPCLILWPFENYIEICNASPSLCTSRFLVVNACMCACIHTYSTSQLWVFLYEY